MNNAKNDYLDIVVQGWYGNRTGTEVRREKIDTFIREYHDSLIDRSIIRIPNMDNIVIVYNKYEEQRRLRKKEDLLKNKNYELKHLAFIPEMGIELYSRCIVCRINEDGELESLQDGDYEKIVKYLAE